MEPDVRNTSILVEDWSRDRWGLRSLFGLREAIRRARSGSYPLMRHMFFPTGGKQAQVVWVSRLLPWTESGLLPSQSTKRLGCDATLMEQVFLIQRGCVQILS